MISNVIRTVLDLRGYLTKIQYPRTLMVTYIVISIAAGTILSNSVRAADLPVLTVVAILFGFTINAVVMLGNSSEDYISSNTKHSAQLEDYYKKSLSISIHTLGIGIVTIVVTGIFQLFPEFDIRLFQIQLLESTLEIKLMGTTAYTLTTYYLIVFSTVIASTAELVKIRASLKEEQPQEGNDSHG